MEGFFALDVEHGNGASAQVGAGNVQGAARTFTADVEVYAAVACQLAALQDVFPAALVAAAVLAAAANREVDQGAARAALDGFVYRLDGFVSAPGGIGRRHRLDPRVVAFAQVLQVFPRHLCRVDQGAAQVHGDACLFVAAVHFLFLFATHDVQLGALCIEVDVTGAVAFGRAECQPLFFGERPACASCMDDGPLFAVMSACVYIDVAVYCPGDVNGYSGLRW